jgi:hypothetical protein
MVIVTDKMVEDSLSYLAESDTLAAVAKANRNRAERNLERVRARLTVESNLGAAPLKRAWAESQPAYEEACENEAEAIETDEQHRNRRNTANTIIEVWRTMCSNQRAGSNFR